MHVGPPPGEALCPPAWFPGATRAHRCGSGPSGTSWQMDARRRPGLPWPLLLQLTGTKILRNLPSCVPQQTQRRGALLLFGREAQRQPRLDSRVWWTGASHTLVVPAGRTQPQAATPSLLARGSGFSCQRMLIGSSRLEAGNVVSNAIKVKLKQVMS